MSFQLRADLEWCDCGGRAIFLDLATDRYFCLPHTANDAFRRLALQVPHRGDEDALEGLCARGLLVIGAGGIARPAQIVPPKADVVAAHRAHALPVLRAFLWELRAMRRLKVRPLKDVLGWLANTRARSGAPRSAPDQDIEAIVAAANVAALVLRAHDRCLVRALAVFGACRRRGIKPILVLGVTAHPFAAHAWVQVGGDVLVGGFEQARLYTPILVLE